MRKNKKAWLYLNGGASLFYPSTDKAIYAGSAPSTMGGYVSFGDVDNDPDDPNIIYKFDRSGSDHNVTIANSACVGMRSTDGGVTWSSQFTIKTTYTTYNIVDVAVQVVKSGANKGRVIVNWGKNKALGAGDLVGASDVMAMYSDDLKSVSDPSTATWSAEYKMFPDYGEKFTTSATSFSIAGVGATLSITIDTGLTNLYVGRRCLVSSRANRTNQIIGRVLTYDTGTGALVLDNIAKGGAGTFSDWDVSFTSYAISTGRGITLPDDSMIKVFHWSEGQTYLGFVHRSTDGGVTWTFQGSVWNTSSEGYTNSHEASLARDPGDGTIWCTRRNDNLGYIIYSTSTDNGATWGTRVHSTIANIGKCPFVFTANRTIVGIGRSTEAGGRTILWQSTDRVNFTSDYIDNRTGVYVYGGLVTMPTKVIAIWSVEAHNVPSPAVSGPTLLIQKDLVQSAVAPPTALDVAYQGLIDFATANGETLPSTALQTKHNTFISDLRANGKLTSDGLWVFKHNDASLALFSLRNWLQAWSKLTAANSPSFDVNGYDFNGTTQYLRTPWNLNNPALGEYLQDDASFIYYTDQTGDGPIAGGTGVGTFSTRTSSVFLNPDFGGSAYANINNAGSPSSAVNAVSSGLWEIDRTSSTSFTLKRNGTTLGTFTVASQTRASAPMYIGVERFASDNLQFYSTRGCGLFALGGARASWNTEWSAYINSL